MLTPSLRLLLSVVVHVAVDADDGQWPSGGVAGGVSKTTTTDADEVVVVVVVAAAGDELSRPPR